LIITPTPFIKGVFKQGYSFPNTQLPVRASNPGFVLEQLGIADLSKDIQMLVGLALPTKMIPIHKDSPLLDGSPIKWSLIFAPADEEVSISLEILEPIEGSKLDEGIGPLLGYKRYSHRRENCKLLETWNLKDGSCYFDPTNYWHGLINHTDKPQYVFSLRSGSIEIEEVLNRLK